MVETPASVSTEIAARGPVVGELFVKRTYRWPVGLAGDRTARSSTQVEHVVAMSVELRAGEPFVRVVLDFDNQADDHRLRFHIPLARTADHSAAEGQYAVVERGLTVEGGHGEVTLPTFPAYGWVDAGGITALLDHVTEYELVDGTELALTCLRSIGMISRNDNPYREDPAGPERPMPAAQMRGRQRIGFGILLHAGEWHQAGVLKAAEEYAHDFVVAPGSHGGDAQPAAEREGLAIAGDGVVMTALQRRGEWLELRVVLEHPTAGRAAIGSGIAQAREVGLLGQIGDELAVAESGSLSLAIEPWQVKTIQLRR